MYIYTEDDDRYFAAQIAAKDQYERGYKQGYEQGLKDAVRQGEWVNTRTSAFCPYEMEVEEKCSLCGRYVYRYGTQHQDNFCPECGADMRGVQHG